MKPQQGDMRLPPDPIVEVAIEAKRPADLERLEDALTKLTRDDACFRYVLDAESTQVVAKGASEEHLASTIDRLLSQLDIGVNVGTPQVAYRETITRTVEQECAYAPRATGMRPFARVVIRFEPIDTNCSFNFENATYDGSVPLEYLPGIFRGLVAAKECGPIAGFPLIGIKATLLGGAHDEVGSSVFAFDNATRGCFRDAIVRAAPKLLEPIVRIEVVASEDAMPAVSADLISRRGRILGTHTRREGRGGVHAVAPLAEMLGYRKTLRATIDPHAWVHVQFDHYEAVPKVLPDDDTFRPAIGMRS